MAGSLEHFIAFGTDIDEWHRWLGTLWFYAKSCAWHRAHLSPPTSHPPGTHLVPAAPVPRHHHVGSLTIATAIRRRTRHVARAAPVAAQPHAPRHPPVLVPRQPALELGAPGPRRRPRRRDGEMGGEAAADGEDRGDAQAVRTRERARGKRDAGGSSAGEIRAVVAKLVADVLDTVIPAAKLDWLEIDDGLVGVAMVCSTLLTGKLVWNKCRPRS
ncbi:hypothetical protein HIM_05930 [Hirsutella minnesotensis 3608]|uniref:Uncharacterized protein n=1 Tax=Hirsutella minnesotensis 3608 TaxID=1043627 RepID=A0A0F7ZNY9_9HYPO|nr:hypothetical protein HIM_05930 [Hirsutella minnesotensis 3608]